jgi:hypothetical protein
MPTIICDAQHLAFIHIPKTAGTTISRQLKKALPHDPDFVEGWTAHPGNGIASAQLSSRSKRAMRSRMLERST